MVTTLTTTLPKVQTSIGPTVSSGNSKTRDNAASTVNGVSKKSFQTRNQELARLKFLSPVVQDKSFNALELQPSSPLQPSPALSSPPALCSASAAVSSFAVPLPSTLLLAAWCFLYACATASAAAAAAVAEGWRARVKFLIAEMRQEEASRV